MTKGRNSGLPRALKDGVEALSGCSMDEVRIHRNSDRPARLQAKALAAGVDAPLTPGGEAAVAEGWHVVQQAHGRISTQRIDADIHVRDDDALEREANAIGARAAQRAPK